MSPESNPLEQLHGRFRIVAELARGGMGTVYSAWDHSAERRVALKRLTKGAPERLATLFEREFYVLASLQHPRIIEVYDYGVDADGPFYTMELLEGSDLRELSPIEPRLACRYLRDVASSLALLHTRRLLHRDVSPRNVRILPGGGAKLIDFGALTSFGPSRDLVGTVPAIPPEAFSGEPLDQRADLFSLGALAYYLLTGRHAYGAREIGGLPEAWRQAVTPPSTFCADVPPELEQLVLSLLSLDVLARPSSAGEVIDVLNVIGGLEPERDEETARAYFVGCALVERLPALERAERLLGRAASGRGGALFVDSNPGAGKTRFLGEVVLKAQLGGISALRVEGGAQSGAFSGARALVEQLRRVLPGAALAPEPGLHGFAEAFEAGIVAVAKEHPLLIAVDDVDQLDPESVALLLTLARNARRERLLVLVTAPAVADASLTAAVRAIRDSGTAIRLRELSEAGVETLVRMAFGNVPHVRRAATRLYSVTQGNPEHCMLLFQRWVESGVVQYAAGAWHVALEIPAEAFVAAHDAVADRLLGCTPDARRVAALVAMLEGPVPFEECVLLESGRRSSREVIGDLGELVRAGVLSETTDGYRFVDGRVRASAHQVVAPETLAALHLRIAEVWLGSENPSPRVLIKAGLHFIRGGDEVRGADLIAKTARAAVIEEAEPARLFADCSAALETALDVYRRAGRSSLSMLQLLVPLVVASYEISPAFAARYGDETIARLEHALGLSAFASRRDIDLEALSSGLARAPVLDPGEERTPETPDVVVLVGWLMTTVLSLAAVAAAVIDHAAQERCVDALLPFTAFGPYHPAVVAYDFGRLIFSMTEDYFARSRDGWMAMLARLEATGFPGFLGVRLRLGALQALGVLECQRGDDAVLARIAQIEAMGLPRGNAIANQIRHLYHGFRGEKEPSDRARERVEAYAMQYGSAWQVEIWSTSTASAFSWNLRDAATHKRSVQQLERLKGASSSLELYYERAAACQHLLIGEPERACKELERLLAGTVPRERVGWTVVRGALARAYNDLGRHREAKELCEETIAVSDDDHEYTGMTMGVRQELCRAFLGLGDIASAKAILAGLFLENEHNRHPAILGALHRAGAEIALAERDTAGFEAHAKAMREWFTSTKNPALIAQCDRLNNVASISGGFRPARPPVTALPTSSLTLVESVLASCAGSDARKQRALELVASQSGANDAWLFTMGRGSEPVVVGKLGVSDAPAELVGQVKALFESVVDDLEEGQDTAETEFADGASITRPTTSAEFPINPYRLFALTVMHERQPLFVGTIGLLFGQAQKPVRHDFLQDLATQLYQAGDIMPASIR